MKSRNLSPLVAVILASLAVLTLSSCNKKTDESVTTNPQNAPTTSSSSPTTATSPSGTTTSPASGTSGVSPQGTACPSGNPIKGITSKKLGGKIHLTSKSPEYSKTKAEKCFPDTAAAVKAGYKAP
ncbi:MAG TPA: hypothetical protein V6D14_34975 [Coleofasciculaceae cyanobacterium]|jgi:hypothetical protein